MKEEKNEWELGAAKTPRSTLVNTPPPGADNFQASSIVWAKQKSSCRAYRSVSYRVEGSLWKCCGAKAA
jgi:hypothetical protein